MYNWVINNWIFTVFILKQSSAEKLNAFLKKVSLNLYPQVISQFLAGAMKRIEKPFFAVRGLDIAVRELDIVVRELDIALGNHALRAQPTDYSLICTD